MKKAVKLVLATLALLLMLLVTVGIFAWSMFGEQVIAANSVTKMDDGLYSMEYRGDYGISELMDRGGAASADELAEYITEFLSHGFYKLEASSPENAYGCSTISARNENGDAVFGRNYDWEDCTVMIVHTVPKDGYESISTVCLDFLGFGNEWLPEGMGNQMMALASVYIPLDGMNEKGLVVADLVAGDNEETHQNTEKPNVTTTLAIRLMLDYAANVDEAIELLRKYDMNSDIGTAHHYSIADASGRSVVVEYINGEMTVTDTRVVTNHYISDSEKKDIGSEQSHDRYSKLITVYEDSQGIMSIADVRDAMQSVSQNKYNNEYEKTVWSIMYVHSGSELSAELYINENYENCYKMNLKNTEENKWLIAP